MPGRQAKRPELREKLFDIAGAWIRGPRWMEKMRGGLDRGHDAIRGKQEVEGPMRLTASSVGGRRHPYASQFNELAATFLSLRLRGLPDAFTRVGEVLICLMPHDLHPK